MATKLWQPSQERVDTAAITRFRKTVEERFSVRLPTYKDLHRWSTTHVSDFWSLVWEFTGVQGSSSWECVADDEVRMPGTDWFPGAKLNFAENLLSGPPEKVALSALREEGPTLSYTYEELRARVAQFAHALKEDGISTGDRVAAIIPNGAEAVIAMLATASIGAVWSSCSPDFGSAGILQRFSQIKPSVLLITDSYYYNGKHYDCAAKNREVVAALPTVRRVISVQSAPEPTVEGSVRFEQYGESAPTSSSYEQLPFLHPLYILFSSGTTGKPKCIVHSAGGTLLQHYKEHQLHCDLSGSDTLFYFTTTGWMMWNWLVSALGSRSKIIVYDGSATFPHPSRLFDIVDNEAVTAFGTSAAFISYLEKAEQKPINTHKLSSLRSLMSTGSPLSPDSFHYVYNSIKEDVQLASISGGTDIVSLFVGGNPTLPVYTGQIQCACLGMDVAVFSSEGQSVVGQKGELVCRKPFVSMPIYFYGDKDGSRYHKAYFKDYPGVWTQGDYALETPEGGFVIFGRSDTVLNAGGVRIGTAEIYREVLAFSVVKDCLAVDWTHDGTTKIALFVQLNEGQTLTDKLVTEMKDRLRVNASPRHVPAQVVQVADIPKTRSGKIVEKAVRQIINGEEVENREALHNPEALDLFRDILPR